jgi:hypothetical protein
MDNSQVVAQAQLYAFGNARAVQRERLRTLEALDTLRDEAPEGEPDEATDAEDYDEAQQRVVEGPGPIP